VQSTIGAVTEGSLWQATHSAFTDAWQRINRCQNFWRHCTYRSVLRVPQHPEENFTMNNPLTRRLGLMLALVLIVAACGSDADDAATATEPENTEDVVAEDADDTADTDDTEAATDEASEDAEADVETDTTAAGGEQVEVNLLDELDGIINGYCLDIAGGNESVDPANGLQAHTCYSYQGDLGTDQVFDSAEFANNTLYMPIYDVCAQVDSAAAGAAVSLATCDGSDAQQFDFADDGTIRPVADTTLCITAGAESRTGRSGDHQIRDLSLETCGDDSVSLQQWGSRTGL